MTSSRVNVIVSYNKAIVENLSGDGGPDAQARIGLAMRTSWARVMMFAPDNEVNQDMVEALEAEGVHDRTVGLHVGGIVV